MINRNYWQQAAGDSDRNYVDICLKWGVILNGPGWAGKWPECADVLKKDGCSSKKITDIRRFAKDINEGDVIALRMGTSEVLAVGVIVGDYEWLDIFGDIDGWSLQHTRRVKWLWQNTAKPKKFKTYTLKLGDTTQKLDSKEVLTWIDSLNLPLENNHSVELLPDDNSHKVSFTEVYERLFDFGVSSQSIEHLTKEVDELIRIAKWYQRSCDPSEFETVTYLAVPLLRALGWTPQKMAIEWNNIDAALFRRLPRNAKNISVVVEAKKKGNSCLSAFEQAANYAKSKEKCERLIVTDGLRYGVYVKKENNFKLYAYLNLTNLKSNYPIYECQGVQSALQAMSPDWDIET